MSKKLTIPPNPFPGKTGKKLSDKTRTKTSRDTQ